MKKIAVFFADGNEEIEGLTVVDVLRRAKVEVVTVSIMGTKEIHGSHGITFFTDALFEETDLSSFDGIVIPGGMPGTTNLGAHKGVLHTVHDFNEKGKMVAAICAAPSVLGQEGLLAGRHATCHPGWEEKLTGAILSEEKAVTDGNIITSRGMGTAIDFSLAMLKLLTDEETVAKVREGIVY